MVLRLLALVSLLFLSQASLARQLETKTPDDVPDTCPVARPLALPSILPWLYPLKPGPREFWVRHGKAVGSLGFHPAENCWG
jgi:hypothetical protein